MKPNRSSFGAFLIVTVMAGGLSAQALPDGIQPYDWALEQMRVPEAQQHTQGSQEIVVAVIDLGYRHHPALDGHLWTNPHPTRGDLHGWDFADNDASLEYSGVGADSSYYRNHHVFVAGEVAAVAPLCPLMILRVGYHQHDSWHQAIRYAVEHGAKVLVIPHGYIGRAAGSDVPLFYQGTDFAYPQDNPKLREALDEAYDRGCLILKGTADNRGRRVVFPECAWEMVSAVGSANRAAAASNMAAHADYVEFAAPAGQRGTGKPSDEIWGLSGSQDYCHFEGGCMASGFAGGAAALVWSQFPQLSNDQLREVLRNTAQPAAGRSPGQRDPQLGYGILDVARAVTLQPEQLVRDVRVSPETAALRESPEGWLLEVELENVGVFDARAMVVAYSADPTMPADSQGTFDAPSASLQVTQLGHVIEPVRGLAKAKTRIQLSHQPSSPVWLETYSLDRHDAGKVHRVMVEIAADGDD